MKTNPTLDIAATYIRLITRFVALGIGIVLSFAPVARAQPTFVSGNISGTWTASLSPYIATANCTVPAGTNLTLQPGVVFEIGSNLTVTVNGTITAVGTPTQRITISAASLTYYYNTISLVYGGVGTNVFTYCDFTNAQTAISMFVEGNNWVMPVEIMNCTFSNCAAQAIYGYAQGAATCGDPQNATLNLVIKNCVFNATGNGCEMNIFGATTSGCANQNWQGYGYANPTIIGNIFQNLTGTAFLMQVGSYAGSGNPVFVNNTMVNCRGGVNAADPWDTLVQGNIFLGCTNAVWDTGLLSRQVNYNDFYGNATNFTGYSSGIYGAITTVNRNGTPSDILYNIYSNPLFVATNDFYLTNSSPCVNAGTPNSAYANMCTPPSISTNFPDLGAYGGPDACNWLSTVPRLPTQISLTKSNGFLWLNWSAVPRSSYEVVYITTNFNATSGTNKWLTNNIMTPGSKPVSVPVSPYPTTNGHAYYRIKNFGRTPGN